jgi:hypothetical protein
MPHQRTIAERIFTHWQASVWWRKQSQIVTVPVCDLQYAANMEALILHMIANPRLYVVSGGLTDWQIYQRENK